MMPLIPTMSSVVVIDGKPVPYAKKRFHPKKQQDQMDNIAKAARRAQWRRWENTPMRLVVRAHLTPPKSTTIADRVVRHSATERDAMIGQWADASPLDLTNIIKLAEDSLKGIAWDDDRRVCNFDGSGKWWSYEPRTEIQMVPLLPVELAT